MNSVFLFPFLITFAALLLPVGLVRLGGPAAGARLTSQDQRLFMAAIFIAVALPGWVMHALPMWQTAVTLSVVIVLTTWSWSTLVQSGKLCEYSPTYCKFLCEMLGLFALLTTWASMLYYVTIHTLLSSPYMRY